MNKEHKKDCNTNKAMSCMVDHLGGICPDKECNCKKSEHYKGECCLACEITGKCLCGIPNIGLIAKESQPPKECNCREMTCKPNCPKDHTHKGFSCELCEPEASAKMRSPEPPKEVIGDWRESLRELYLTESPDDRGEFTKSITFNWGKFEFTQVDKEKGKVAFYLTTQGGIEEFIEQTIHQAKQEERTRIEKVIDGLDMALETMEFNLPLENSPDIFGDQRVRAYKNGYNQVLNNLKTKIKE